MDVYINMEMPKSCDDCRLNNGISCYAVPEYTEDGVVGRTDDRPEWCPLVPVPPHGDLIDYDFCIKNYELLHDDDWNPVYAVRMRDINNAPTIIPADPAEGRVMALLSLDRHDVLESNRQSNSLHDAFLRVAKLPAVGEYRTATNADLLRSMTDEELADWFSIYCCRDKTYDDHCETFGNCKACWIDWLKEEAKP